MEITLIIVLLLAWAITAYLIYRQTICTKASIIQEVYRENCRLKEDYQFLLKEHTKLQEDFKSLKARNLLCLKDKEFLNKVIKEQKQTIDQLELQLERKDRIINNLSERVYKSNSRF